MEIYIKEVNIEESNTNDIKFKKLYNNSYKEAIKYSSNKDKIGRDWNAIIHVEDEYEEVDLDFTVDTKGNFITYLDLDGYLEGEVVNLDEEVELHLALRDNSIYEALVFMEVKKLNILPEEKLKSIEYSLFPKFAKGYIATDLKQDTNVGKFIEVFAPLLEKYEILKKLDIEKTNYRIKGLEEDDKNIFRDEMNRYLFEDLYFIYYDRGYGEFLSKKDFNELLLAGSKFEADTTLVDLYE